MRASASMKGKVALVTGANRGIGLGLSRAMAGRGATVLMVCRNEAAGLKAVGQLCGEGLDVALHLADVADPAGIEALYAEVAGKCDRLDVLANNAAVLLRAEDLSIERMTLDVLTQTMDTNFRGSFWMCRTFLPLLRASPSGRIINFTSGLGRLSVETGGSFPAYSISKTAVNALTKVLAEELRGTGVMAFSVDPGWVKTDMGGAGARISVEESVESILYLAAADAAELQSGRLYSRRQVVSW